MSGVAGTVRLVRLALRRDRVRLAVWIVGLTATMVASAASLRGVYADQRAIDSYAAVFGGNPALMAFAGPGYGLDDPTIGAILVNETQLWGAIAIALMSTFVVVRLTRADEDAERTDLVLSTATGRHAPLLAALIVVAFAEIVVAVACAIGIALLGYAAVGSVALCASLLAVGLVFAGVAAMAAQIAGSARGALGLSSFVLALAFVLRAVGDITGSALVWSSPIGWAQAARAFAGERWWPIALCVVVALAVVATAGAMAQQRDLGSALVVRRSRTVTDSVRTPLALAWHRQRGVITAWTVGLAAIGAVYGSIADDVEALLRDNPLLAEFLAALQGADLVDAYVATAVTMMSIIASAATVSTMLEPHRDETAGRLDLVWASPLPRARWMVASVAVSMVASTVVVVGSGLGLGLATAATLDDADWILRCIEASLNTLPAVGVLLGITALLVGALPHRAELAWVALALVGLIGFFGDALDLPGAITSLSPFEFVAAMPAEAPSWPAAVALTVIGGAAAVLGLVAVGRRDQA